MTGFLVVQVLGLVMIVPTLEREERSNCGRRFSGELRAVAVAAEAPPTLGHSFKFGW